MNKTVAAAVMAALLLGTLTAAVVLVIGTAAWPQHWNWGVYSLWKSDVIGNNEGTCWHG
jgi:hypothetical protein